MNLFHKYIQINGKSNICSVAVTHLAVYLSFAIRINTYRFGQNALNVHYRSQECEWTWTYYRRDLMRLSMKSMKREGTIL